MEERDEVARTGGVGDGRLRRGPGAEVLLRVVGTTGNWCREQSSNIYQSDFRELRVKSSASLIDSCLGELSISSLG